MFGIGKQEVEAVRKTIEQGYLSRFQGGTKGYLARSERKLAEKMNCRHVLMVNSGTSALISSLVALGIGPGDEVLVAAYTWIATPLAPMILGAIPILVEVDESLTMDPKDLERKITPKTKAIIPVHMRNMPSSMDRIMAIANQHGVPVLEDACQSVGVSYKGRRLGTIGAIGAFSFNNYKNISCGEGGAILTNDDVLFDRARMYHDAGTFVQAYDSAVRIPHFAGQDFRASEIDGAIIYEQLKRLDPGLKKWNQRVAFARELVRQETNLKISRHNDPRNAVTLLVHFQTEDEAKEFSERHQVARFINTGRHVYTNWDPLVNRQAYRDDVNPLITPEGRKITYDENTAPVTLDLLRRTCDITPPWNAPLRSVEKWIKSMKS